MHSKILRLIGSVTGIAVVVLAAGCASNPVTGRKELHLVSEQQERKIGANNYDSYQQAEGGTYVADPEVVAYVNRVGEKLWAVSDRPQFDYEIVVLNNSVPNAWAIPGGKLAVNRGLLTELHSEAELAAVLGHEIVHVAARHGAKSMETGMLLQGAMVGVGLAVSDMDQKDIITGASGLVAGLTTLKFSRGHELEADKYGIEYMHRAGYDPQAAVALQQTFLNLANGKSSNWLMGLFASHPPSEERLKANRVTAAKYPAGGFVGTSEYAQAMIPLLKTKPAYSAAEKGYAALARNDNAGALAFANQALAIEPREAQFHTLAAKAYAGQHQTDKALAQLNRAVELNGNDFSSYLLRGQLQYDAGNASAARSDLQKSAQLLPTGTSHYLLGMLDVQGGNERAAREHFRLAASSDSEDGQKAGLLLTRMELGEQPDRYLQVGYSLGPKGYLVLNVQNATPVDVGHCVMSVYSPKSGRWESYQFPQGLPARRTAILPTRVGPFANVGEAQQTVRYRFDQVRVADGNFSGGAGRGRFR